MNTHYALRGGASGYGAACGAFYVVGIASSGATGWVYGAALSLFHIILFVVVILVKVILVVLSVFLLALLLLMLPGILVLLYCASYYSLSGGHSNNSTGCGVFCVYANLIASTSSWHLGAAL